MTSPLQENLQKLKNATNSLLFNVWVLQAVAHRSGIQKEINLLKHDIERACKLRKFVIRD